MKVIFLLNGKIGGAFIKHVCKTSKIEIVACISEHPEIISDASPGTPIEKFEYGDNYQFLEYYQFDCIISYNWNYRLPEEICDKYNCYNFHQALLPRHRGPIPLVFTILQNDIEAGVTLHRMRRDFDKGEIYAQEKFFLTEDTTYVLLNLKCLKAALVLLKRFVSEYPNIKCVEQNELYASYESLKELDKYVITEETSLEHFKRIVRAYNDVIPLLCARDDKVTRVVNFSYLFDNPNFTKLLLKDAIIFVMEEDWNGDKYDKLLYKLLEN